MGEPEGEITISSNGAVIFTNKTSLDPFNFANLLLWL
jgi:hypothetical protein